MMQENDILLIGRILKGDNSGYSVLVERYKDLAFTIAMRILGKHEDAEEVVQDAFVKAFRGLSGFRQNAQFSTWLYRIVYNTAISRKRVKGMNLKSLEEIPSLDVHEEEYEDQERTSMLEKALNKLPEDERALITLYYLNESSVEEIHQITGLSKANVKIKLFRARKKMHEWVMQAAEKIYN